MTAPTATLTLPTKADRAPLTVPEIIASCEIDMYPAPDRDDEEMLVRVERLLLVAIALLLSGTAWLAAGWLL